MTDHEVYVLRKAALACDYTFCRLKTPWHQATLNQQMEALRWAEHIAPHTCCIDDAHLYLAGGIYALLPVEACVIDLFEAADRIAKS